jgi:uncharacterized protein YjiS (DUF1127 family)
MSFVRAVQTTAAPAPLGRLFAGLADRWAAAEARRRDARRLREAPDHLLRDLGLTRDDVRDRQALLARLMHPG